jgi:hypothetical protein
VTTPPQQVPVERMHTASTRQVPGKLPAGNPASTPQVVAVLVAASGGDATREELQSAAGLKDREHFRKEYLQPLLSRAFWN